MEPNFRLIVYPYIGSTAEPMIYNGYKRYDAASNAISLFPEHYNIYIEKEVDGVWMRNW